MSDNFSTDQDLLRREPQLEEYMPESQSSWHEQHSEAKKEIVTDLINDQIIKLRQIDNYDDAEQFILRPEELNRCSIFKTLEIIFNTLAQGDDSFHRSWEIYSKKYIAEYDKVKNALSIDLDRDGVEDESEIGADHSTRLRLS